MKQTLLGLGGALVGGVVGHFAFLWLVHHGLYGLILPGGLLGLGAGVARPRSVWLGVICGLLAVALGLFTDWRYEWFKDDPSFGYFLLHAYKLDAVALLMIGVGAAIAFWVPYSRIEKDHRPGADTGPKQDTN
jgi:hypothetical protein